ncbi:DUF349 domain-containing protein [Flavobacterium branchiophilum]|uniref:DUF349 domain-containing protein n=1 Tax=Flavobacterium branchiophilum (strain FL-15) TaxID=1034807 RepID=G2Z164_FLABF|nr:DUF349 domain-containing protein [Flavobacterium branchiophilum]CCB69627.1 Protein of unknown function [Flavobacterium branchiophilum FL-15]
MLEEKNDNLQEADGALENANQMTASTQSQDFENSMNNAAVEAISSEVAAQGESDIKNISQIPIENYESMAMEDIVTSLESLVQNEQIMAFKSHIEEAKTAFLSKYYEFIDEKRAQFEAENADTNEEFQYHFPLKNKFDQLYTLFKDQKNKHFKSLQNDLQANLNKRLEIVEELKNLVGAQDNIPNALKQLNDLRERWKNAGAIPKDKYNHVWNNYHFHIENFYDFLHLDREARDLDFKHNLDLKLKIIARCEQLLSETDLNKAFRELQDLHRMWKEDIGPVSKEHREEIWIKFSDLTKQMHDKREQMYEQVRLIEQDNLSQKSIIIEALEVLAKHKVDSHNLWLSQIDQVEALRNAFFQVGKVPVEVNEATWQRFKNAVKDFNTLKNSFYKEIKKDQHDNLSKKQALVAKANELKDSTDFELTTPIMKQIQDEWKTIGHVPRKISDSLWKEFREACNHYFEKLKEFKSIENTDEVEAFEKKKDYMEVIRAFEMTGDHRTDLNAIKVHIDNWKSFGKVPFTRRHIDGKFNKILDALFEKLSLSKKESEMVRFSNKLEQISESNDGRKLENEKIFIIRKIEEVQSEIFQLENNIQFFANTRNAKKENSIVLEVRKNIEKHKEELVLLKDKLKQIRNFKSEE